MPTSEAVLIHDPATPIPANPSCGVEYGDTLPTTSGMEQRKTGIMSTPAGWYPQPDGQQRYWDGESWTENFAPGVSPETPLGVSAETHPTARKNWFLRHKVITAIGAVLLIGAFSNLANGGGKSDTTALVSDTVATSASPEKAAADKAAAELAASNQAATDKAAADQAVVDQAAADKAAAAQAVIDKAAADKAAAAKAAADKAAAAKAAAAKKIADANRLTTAQENAKRSAESYLEMSGFSRSGLIDQLKFEGFSVNDATRAIDSMKVNWNTEADQSAKSYIDMSGFSRSGLIGQLKFEGFTTAQAAHGADSVGL
jgi:hypothetical protein